MWRRRSIFREGFSPGVERVAQGREFNAAELFRIGFEVARGPRQQRTGAGPISAAVVVQSDRNLDQSLQEFLLRVMRLTPEILEHFVGLEEFFAVEQLDSPVVSVVGHRPILAHDLQGLGCVSTGFHRPRSGTLQFSIT
jgi:hypothetical protein